MKKILFKIVLMAVMLVPLVLALPLQAATISVGNDTVARQVLDICSNCTIIDTNHPVSANGGLTEFRYYAANQNPFRFVLVDENDTVQWVSDEIMPPAIGVNAYTPTSTVSVQIGWNLGVYFVSTGGAIPFDSRGEYAFYKYIGSGSLLPVVGETLSYDGADPRIYSFSATGDTVIAPPATVNVTIVKYLNGKQANAASANNAVFTMNATSGSFVLGPDNPNPYQAMSPAMTSGASYSVSEDTSQNTVGTSCSNGQLYQLVGYTVGDTLVQAINATPVVASPNLRNIKNDKFIVVWNKTCGLPDVMVGNDTIDRSVLDVFNNFTVIDTNNPVSANGWLTSFQYYASNQNPFRFWLVDANLVVQWVSDEIIPPGTGVNVFTPTSPVPAQKGWNLGVFFLLTGTIPFEWGGAASYYKISDSGSPLPIVGRQFAYDGSDNRNYSFAATGVTSISQPATVNVTVVKYLDGTRADAVSANNTSFPMNATWEVANISPGYGSGSFVLGPDNPNPYQATTPAMTSGASYSVSEDTRQNTVGTSCNNGQLYQLVGYTVGNTLVQAVLARQTTRTPSLTNIVNNKYIIVWNETCKAGNDDCGHDDNGHHYGNDKGDNHHSQKNKCKSDDNGHHYGNDKGDKHQSSKDKDKDKKGKDGGKR